MQSDGCSIHPPMLRKYFLMGIGLRGAHTQVFSHSLIPYIQGLWGYLSVKAQFKSNIIEIYTGYRCRFIYIIQFSTAWQATRKSLYTPAYASSYSQNPHYSVPRSTTRRPSISLQSQETASNRYYKKYHMSAITLGLGMPNGINKEKRKHHIAAASDCR